MRIRGIEGMRSVGTKRYDNYGDEVHNYAVPPLTMMISGNWKVEYALTEDICLCAFALLFSGVGDWQPSPSWRRRGSRPL
jgi:hypothetical protein